MKYWLSMRKRKRLLTSLLFKVVQSTRKLTNVYCCAFKNLSTLAGVFKYMSLQGSFKNVNVYVWMGPQIDLSFSRHDLTRGSSAKIVGSANQ